MDRRNEALIEQLLQEIIKGYNIPTPIDNIDEVVKNMGGLVSNEDTFDKPYGTVRKQGNGFEIRVPQYETREQRNIGIAREIGHLFLHMGYQINPKLWEKQSEREFKAFFSDSRYEADYFAYNLLMPKKDFLYSIDSLSDGEHINTALIANRYKVDVATVNVYGRILGVFNMPWEY